MTSEMAEAIGTVVGMGIVALIVCYEPTIDWPDFDEDDL